MEPVDQPRLRTVDFDYALPPELIAQSPAGERDGSRLLVWDRKTGVLAHRAFREIVDLLPSPAVLVTNDTRVIPARLRAMNAETGGSFEVMLIGENAPNDWWAMVRPGRRAPVGRTLVIRDRTGAATTLRARVVEVNAEGHRRLLFEGTGNLVQALEAFGETPLPPYITRNAGADEAADRDRYQTVYARQPGSVAAPTAGLHFTPRLLEAVQARGIRLVSVTLHVGAGTFAPVKSEHVDEHRMHREPYWIGAEAAATIQDAKRRGHPVIAVGTTSLRVLESVARDHPDGLAPGSGTTRLFLYPPAEFHVVDGLITNFHLPQSTLLMLVSAFAAPGSRAGRDSTLRVYAEAIRARYRFFSYGDALFIQ
jgi:S-adenosylmethionine:tRNA ribosyltransferase-isomerase